MLNQHNFNVAEMSDQVPDNSLEHSALRRLGEEAEDIIDDVMEIDHHQISASWDRAVAFFGRTTPVQQFGIGFSVGWLSGYLFKRVSRTAAFLLGLSFLAAQGAHALGIIRINWQQLQRVAQSRTGSVSRAAQNLGLTSTSPVGQVVEFGHRHMFLTSGFASGAIVSITF